MNGKRPIGKEWQKAPHPTLETVLAWARSHNLGLRTGKASGVIVIDDDTPEGSGAEVLDLPETPTVRTGSGGFHYYFRAPDKEVSNSAGKLAPKVDVRGERGCVVYPGSIHPSTGKPYCWIEGLSPLDVDLAPFPEHLLEKLQKKKRPKKPRSRTQAEASLRKACDELANAPEGVRNDTLNKKAFLLGQRVGLGCLEETSVRDALRNAALSAGLEEGEVLATINSALQAGMAAPKEGRAIRKAGLPVIELVPGELSNVVDQGEAALLRLGGGEVFARGSILVRVLRVPSASLQGWLARRAGALVIQPIDSTYMTELFTRSARWKRWSSEQEDWVDTDCPKKIACTYLARGKWKAPNLVAVIEAPTLRPDGTLLTQPGHDSQTGLYLDAGGTKFESISKAPTKGDAATALKSLEWLIKGFPFREACDKSAALAAILTALVRVRLRTSPLFAFRAPTMGTGKSLLADVISMIATGRPAAVMSQGNNEEEDRKRITALLVEGSSVICIDNIERPLGSAALCSVLTQTLWKDRILGKTETVTVPSCSTWLATGNNLVVEGDLVTRVIPCDLDARVERPEEREFDVNLHEYVPAHRGALVAAGLTVLKAYLVAGRPSQGLARFGRFEEWSDLVRSALVWCGQPDPCLGRERLSRIDPVRSQHLGLMRAWRSAFGDTPVTAAQVLNKSGEADELRLALEGISSSGEGLRVQALGIWLSKYSGRIVEGLTIRRLDTKSGSARWSVDDDSAS